MCLRFYNFSQSTHTAIQLAGQQTDVFAFALTISGAARDRGQVIAAHLSFCPIFSSFQSDDSFLHCSKLNKGFAFVRSGTKSDADAPLLTSIYSSRKKKQRARRERCGAITKRLVPINWPWPLRVNLPSGRGGGEKGRGGWRRGNREKNYNNSINRKVYFPSQQE